MMQALQGIRATNFLGGFPVRISPLHCGFLGAGGGGGGGAPACWAGGCVFLVFPGKLPFLLPGRWLLASCVKNTKRPRSSLCFAFFGQSRETNLILAISIFPCFPGPSYIAPTRSESGVDAFPVDSIRSNDALRVSWHRSSPQIPAGLVPNANSSSKRGVLFFEP